jgi:hypothetical protein
MKPIGIVLAVLLGAAALLPARAETIDVDDSHGGRVADYDARWAAHAGARVRIVGPCQSACTVLLAHVPRSRICVTPQASLGFHLAHRSQATATLWSGYPADIRAWIDAHGGLQRDFLWMRAPEIYRFFRRC